MACVWEALIPSADDYPAINRRWRLTAYTQGLHAIESLTCVLDPDDDSLQLGFLLPPDLGGLPVSDTLAIVLDIDNPHVPVSVLAPLSGFQLRKYSPGPGLIRALVPDLPATGSAGSVGSVGYVGSAGSAGSARPSGVSSASAVHNAEGWRVVSVQEDAHKYVLDLGRGAVANTTTAIGAAAGAKLSKSRARSAGTLLLIDCQGPGSGTTSHKVRVCIGSNSSGVSGGRLRGKAGAAEGPSSPPVHLDLALPWPVMLERDASGLGACEDGSDLVEWTADDGIRIHLLKAQVRTSL